MALSTHRSISTVNLQICGIDKSSIATGQEAHSTSHLSHLTQPATDMEFAPSGLPMATTSICSCLRHFRGPDPARGNRVHSDPVLCQVQGHVLCQNVDRTLGSSICPPVWLSLMSRYAAQIDNAAVFFQRVALHLLHCCLDHEAGSSHINLHCLVPVVLCGSKAFRAKVGNTVDKVVETSKVSSNLRNHLEAVVSHRDIQLVELGMLC